MTEEPAEAEIQGWYYRDPASKPARVRLTLTDRTIDLHTLSDRIVASWSLDQLENREIAVLAERWSIGDQRLPEASLVLESDRDYGAVRKRSATLRPIRTRLWRELGSAAIESGNLTGWSVLLLFVVSAAIYWLWQNLPLEYCIATQLDRILFLKCLLVDHFIPK